MEEVVRQEFPGSSYVNLADFGVGYDDNLKFITNKNGKVVEAEVAMPFEFAEDLEITEDMMDERGNILWDKLKHNRQRKALQMILYLQMKKNWN